MASPSVSLSAVATPSPATSGAEGSDDASSSSRRSTVRSEPEPAPANELDALAKKNTKKPAKPKRDPVEQRAAYLAKRREIKARARSRKKETASSLTEQHALLKKQLAAALQRYQTNTRAILRERLGTDDARLQQLWDAYVEALELQEAITQENKHLVDRIDEFLLVECRLLLPEFDPSNLAAEEPPVSPDESSIASAYVDPMDPRGHSPPTLLREAATLLHKHGYWTHFQEEQDAPFYFAFYRSSECNAVIARTYESMRRDIDEASARQWAFSAGCYGWQGFGNIDADDPARVRFQFRKTLPRASSSDLLDEMTRETSRIFHSPTLYARLYGMRMESQVMQRVDDYTSVILQAMSDEHRTLSLRSFMLFSCVEERLPPTAASKGQGRRAMTILNVVLPPRAQDVSTAPASSQNLVLYLTECLIYMRLEQVDEHHLAVTYGGHAHCMSPDLARVCVLESVSSFFRWVQHVIPERLVAFN